MWNGSPAMKHFGARLDFERVHRVRALIDPVRDIHRGGLGTDAVNGVVLAGLFDLVIGTVGWLVRPDTRSYGSWIDTCANWLKQHGFLEAARDASPERK